MCVISFFGERNLTFASSNNYSFLKGVFFMKTYLLGGFLWGCFNWTLSIYNPRVISYYFLWQWVYLAQFHSCIQHYFYLQKNQQLPPNEWRNIPFESGNLPLLWSILLFQWQAKIHRGPRRQSPLSCWRSSCWMIWVVLDNSGLFSSFWIHLMRRKTNSYMIWDKN